MSWQSRLQLSTVALVVSVMLGFIALGFAGLAMFIALSEVYQASVAAVITAGIFIGVALLLTFTISCINKLQKTKRKQVPETSQNDVDVITDMLANPALAELIKQHPGKSMLATIAAGVVFGYSAEARDMLKTFSKQYTEKSSR